MKRTMILLLTVVPSLGAVLLALTASLDAGTRACLTQSFIMTALAGLLLTAWVGRRRAHPAPVHTRRSVVLGESEGACTFSDVAANENALQSLAELADYLKNPEKYTNYGARMPRGILLYGPPGTGKTLMARALAGEAGVPFFAISGSDFVEKYVGVGASRVRELFKKGRKTGRCVIFIDEIDAVGKRRDDSASDERDQTLNALLSEMSGFHSGDGIVVMAATNRIEALDPALLRPGRFDRQIEVGLPGKDQRLNILRLHSRNKPLEPGINLEELAAQTVTFSGASLENLLNEAALSAARRGNGAITRNDLQNALYRIIAGADQPIAATQRERRIIAIHESGHALASHILLPENRLKRISILPAGHGLAGYNLCIPAERVMVEKGHLEKQIQVLLAGRAAEQLTFGDEGITAGASSDLTRATELATAMITELGMGNDVSVSLKALSHCCGGSPEAAEICKALLRRLYDRVQRLLLSQADALNTLADALIEAESMDGDRAVHIIEDRLSIERQETA